MNAYSSNAKASDMRRVVVDLPEGLFARLDMWGVASGKRSRAEAVRKLLSDALDEQEAQQNEPT